jgi:hypothetical protein
MTDPTKILVTICYGRYTHSFLVEEWEFAFMALRNMTGIDKADWVRVQQIPIL